MEAQLKVGNGRLVIKLDAPNVKELFKAVAATDEIFNAEKDCGLCHSTDLRFVARIISDNTFYELRCEHCFARFQFGQTRAGANLFPKRRDEQGYLANGGWSKYTNGNVAEQEAKS